MTLGGVAGGIGLDGSGFGAGVSGISIDKCNDEGNDQRENLHWRKRLRCIRH
jgi:hypothetical protein